MRKTVSPFFDASIKLFSCLLLCLFVALIGGWFTEDALHGWYANLNKPFLTPPGWVFPLVWTPLYILMGLSLWLIIMKTDKPRPTFWCYFWFSIQLLLNLAWSPAFFYFECSLCGGLILTALLIAIALTIWNFHKFVPIAAYLLIPYFVWVLYAGVLNYAIFWMNA